MAEAFKCDCCGNFYEDNDGKNRYVIRIGPARNMFASYYENEDAIYRRDLCEKCATTIKTYIVLLNKMYDGFADAVNVIPEKVEVPNEK